MIPFPLGLYGRSIFSVPLLNQLSATTNVVAAYSTARRLKLSATAGFWSTTVGGLPSAIGFIGGIINTAALIGNANFALYGGAGGLTARALIDQTGNGNDLGPGNGSSKYCAITTPAGALNAPFTLANGKQVPAFSLQYNGLSVGTNGPFLGTAVGLPGGNMAVSYGASTTMWCLAVLRPLTGGNQFGRWASFIHTGDTNDFQFNTSAEILCRDSTTTDIVFTGRNAVTAGGTGTIGVPQVIGCVWTGAVGSFYINGVHQTPDAAFTAALGSGGAFSIGDVPNAGSSGNNPAVGDMVELITGTFTNSAASFLSGDWPLMTNNMRGAFNI